MTRLAESRWSEESAGDVEMSDQLLFAHATAAKLHPSESQSSDPSKGGRLRECRGRTKKL